MQQGQCARPREWGPYTAHTMDTHTHGYTLGQHRWRQTSRRRTDASRESRRVEGHRARGSGRRASSCAEIDELLMRRCVGQAHLFEHEVCAFEDVNQPVGKESVAVVGWMDAIVVEVGEAQAAERGVGLHRVPWAA